MDELPSRIYALFEAPCQVYAITRDCRNKSPILQATIIVGGAAEVMEKKSFKPQGSTVSHGVLEDGGELGAAQGLCLAQGLWHFDPKFRKVVHGLALDPWPGSDLG